MRAFEFINEAPSRWATSAAAQQAQAGGRDTKNTAIQNAQDMERFREKIMRRMEREANAFENFMQKLTKR